MPNQTRVALVTSEGIPNLTPSDRVLAAALRAREVECVAAVWSDPATDWLAFDLVVVRSPWDYFLRIDEFLAWIVRLETAGARLANRPSVLRWNTHKRYLAELADRGAPVPPSLWLERGSDVDVGEVVSARGWSRLVIKPAVSGGAHETWTADFPLSATDSARIRTMVGRGDVLVQPFLEAVPREGEMSFMFIEGRFTHAVRKRAKSGDFRVQIEHGGTFGREDVTTEQVQKAARVLALAPEPTLYGRVDAVLSGEEFLIMELELVEPDLFFETAPEAADTLAAAIQSRAAAAFA